MTIDRRQFLALGAGGLATGLFSNLFIPRTFGQNLTDATAVPTGGMLPLNAKKMVVIFLRGGNDGVNTVIPHGDNMYNTTTRPTLYMGPGTTLDLGNSFAALHPGLNEMHDVFNQGDVAVIHRVGYQGLNRSHFQGQHYWENAKPGDVSLEEGWLYRHAANAYNLNSNPLAAVSASNKLMLMLRGNDPIPQISNLSSWSLDAPGASQSKILGALPGGGTGSGLLGAYGRDLGKSFGYEGSVATQGVAVGSTLVALQAAGIDPATYVPSNGAIYPSSGTPDGFPSNSFGFFRQLRDSAQLLKETDLRVVGLEWGGFDLHSNQGSATGNHQQRLRVIGRAVKALSQDLAADWDDTLVVTMSEFGRTSEENGSQGTDHGEASCMFVAGGGVNGGVYNCDSTTWSNGDLLSTPNGRYIAHVTDFRAVLGEIFDRHFDVADVNTVIPSWSTLSMQTDFTPLGFLPATP